MPVIPAAGALIGLSGAAGMIAGSVIVGAAVGGITSALAGGKIGKGILTGAVTGLAGGALGAAMAPAATTGATVAEAGSTVATGGLGTVAGSPMVPMANAVGVTPASASSGGLLKTIAPSLNQWTGGVTGSAASAPMAGATGVLKPGTVQTGGVGTPPPTTPPPVTPVVDPTVLAAKEIVKGQMLSGAMQGAGGYFTAKEEAEAAEKLLAQQLEARKVHYNGTPGLLRATIAERSPRRASFNRQTGRWEYAPAQ